MSLLYHATRRPRPRSYRASPKAISPSAISSRSALRGSRPLYPIDTGGIFSLPGSLILLTTFLPPFVTTTLLFFSLGGKGSVLEAATSVSSNTTVAFPPMPSPRRIEGVRFRGARLGALEERQVVSSEGFRMFFVIGERGGWFAFRESGMRGALLGRGMLGCWVWVGWRTWRGRETRGPGWSMVPVTGTEDLGSRLTDCRLFWNHIYESVSFQFPTSMLKTGGAGVLMRSEIPERLCHPCQSSWQSHHGPPWTASHTL